MKMRVVIEIEVGEHAQITTSPSGVTIVRSTDSNPGDDHHATAADPNSLGEDQSAGAAPGSEPSSDEPEAIDNTAEVAMDGTEMMGAGVAPAIDAGSAPDPDVDPGQAFDADPPGDAGALDAGPAPDEGVPDAEPPEDTGIGDLDGIPAMDAGAAPEDLINETIPTATEPDDLTLISGLGPRSAAALTAAGITTFAELAARNDDELRQIVGDAGITVSVESWATQAKSLG